MRVRKENADERPIDFYTVSDTKTRRPYVESRFRTRCVIDTICVDQRQPTVDVPSVYVYRVADARNVRRAYA